MMTRVTCDMWCVKLFLLASPPTLKSLHPPPPGVGIALTSSFLSRGFLAELSKAGIAETMTSLLLDDGGFVVMSQMEEVGGGRGDVIAIV